MTLQTTLQAPYSRDAWLALLRDLFGPSAALFARPAPIPDPAYAGVFTRVLHLGDLTTADGKTAALLDITVAPSVSLPRNRASVRHLAARLVDGTTRQAILAVFHGDPVPDWRFSFIIREKSLDLATGQTRTAETPARRFTYLLGPNETCRTAAERFALLRDADAGRVTLADIETAFKVDKLTKEFYGELSDWYFWALTQVRFPPDIEKDKETRNATMTIRLITRLMFVWFLKKKGVIPDCLFDKTSVDAWLSYTDATGSTYYKAILQNLFFATLNFDPKEGARGFVEWGKKGVLAYRYKRFFKRGAADRFLGVCQAIPFLNGGLFENLDKDVETASPRRLDCFSNTDENEKRLAVPDALFFAKEQIVDLSAFYDDKRKSAVRVKGLFEILNAYNFTVEENTPYDQEVALDPELLGQVFENLLASYNPETRTTARKQTGSFYTPREIVQYMVDESLKAHLIEKVGQAFLPADSAKVEQTFLPADSAKVEQAFLPAGAPRPCSLSSSSPSQTGMSAPPPVGQAFLPAHSAAWQMGADDALAISRRRLPHWRHDGAIYWVTFRLADSIPADKLRAWQEERAVWLHHHPAPWTEEQRDEYDERFGKRFETWLDAGMGSCSLSRPDVRQAVADCLLRFDGGRLTVHAAVIMPTHVHALIEPLPVGQTGMSAQPCHDLSALLKGIKGASARTANKLLGTSGTFWLDESYDHIVRSEKQYARFLDYIAQNPVKASLPESDYWLHLPLQNVGQAFLPASQPSPATLSVSSPAQTGMSTPPYAGQVLPPADPAKVGQAFLPAVSPESCALSDSSPSQTGMSAPPPGMSAPPHADPKVGQAFLPATLSERLDALFSYTDEPLHLSEAERAAIVQALFTCKILDPACGSGAFPMGVLQQMVHILNRLDPDNTYLKTQALKQVEEETRAVVNDASALDDKIEKMRDTLRLFDETATRPDYARKLLLIENNIFGVDIQPVAVQIAKLRFFISLIVEQPTQRGADLPGRGADIPGRGADLPGRGADIPVCDTDTKDPDGEGMPGASVCPTHGGADILVCAGQAGMPAPPCGDDIRPLPNLETNFVAANTLIGITKPADTLFADDPQVAAIERELKANRHRHFFARTTRTKLACRKEDKRLRDRLQQRLVDLASKLDEQVITDNLARIAKLEADRTRFLDEKWEEREQTVQNDFFGAPKPEQQTLPLRVDVNKDRREAIEADIRHCQSRMAAEEAKTRDNAFTREAEKLALWDPYDQNATSPFFDPEWMFGITGGFDVVIGNPPYISHDQISCKEQLKKHFLRTWSPFADVYCYFFDRGIELLGLHGVLTFITSNSFIKTEYGEPLRKLLGHDNTVSSMLNIEDSQVFSSAIVNTAIASIHKGKPSSDKVSVVSNAPFNETSVHEYVEARAFRLPALRFRAASWILEPEPVLRLLDKIESFGKPLKDCNAKIRLGVATGDNKAFLLTREQRDVFVHSNIRNGDILKPILRGRDIPRWLYEEPTCYLIASQNGMNLKKDYPDLFKHLDSFGDSFKRRGAQGQEWWNLRACSFYGDFLKEKIVWIELTDKARFALSTDGAYCLNSAYFMLPPVGFDSRFLLGFLNSKLVDFYVRHMAETSGMGTMRWINNVVERIPVPAIPLPKQEPLAALVVRILEARRAAIAADVSALESKIDRLVYGFYGLTDSDIAIVEGNPI